MSKDSFIEGHVKQDTALSKEVSKKQSLRAFEGQRFAINAQHGEKTGCCGSYNPGHAHLIDIAMSCQWKPAWFDKSPGLMRMSSTAHVGHA